ncbi:MAG: serine/threonine-protein kinase [Chloroflexi bacterium]|nr:serine/threonine-protein kinase [Chloroflexota bacterium]
MALERDSLLHKRYRIIENLGQGGMGSVYRAIDENLGVEVAVKENLFTTEEYARQFRLEAVILANLRHPNLPRVSNHFIISEQGQYLVMDFVRGEDLRQRTERVGPLMEDDVIQIGAAICDALSYLHSRRPPILHRDIKPGNVKITPDGHIILVDFGLAKVIQGNQVTTIGARAMTPGYSPPEQYGTARTDHRTDIYALGATLYVALTGVIPEDGLARAMDTAQLTPLRKRNTRISRRLAGTIEKAMSVDSMDRFQTADEFKRALLESKSRTQQLVGTYTVAPPPHDMPAPRTVTLQSIQLTHSTSPDTDQPFVSPRKKQLMRESRIRRIIIGVLLAVLASGFIFVNYFFPGLLSVRAQNLFAMSSGTNDPITIIPVTPTDALELPPSPPPEEEPTPDVSLSTPTQFYVPTPIGAESLEIAFASTRSGISQIYITDLLGSKLRQLTTMPEGACQPSWSPDGTRLVFTSPCRYKNDSYNDSSLYIINADGSGVQNLPSVPGGDFDPVWSPDGREIAFTSSRSGHMQIYVYDLEEKSLLRLTRTPLGTSAHQPAWSPDGGRIAYAYSRNDDVYQIWLMSDIGNNQHQFVRSGDQFSDNLPTWSPDGKLVLFHQRPTGKFAFPDLMMISFEPDATSVKLNLGILSLDDVDYSPEGFWLAFEGSGVRGADIFFMTVTGANQTKLTDDPSDDFDPDWRPVIK